MEDSCDSDKVASEDSDATVSGFLAAVSNDGSDVVASDNAEALVRGDSAAGAIDNSEAASLGKSEWVASSC